MAAARSNQQELAAAAHQLMATHRPLQQLMREQLQQQPQQFGGMLHMYTSHQGPGMGTGLGQHTAPVQGEQEQRGFRGGPSA
jgi:hypothetical protein